MVLPGKQLISLTRHLTVLVYTPYFIFEEKTVSYPFISKDQRSSLVLMQGTLVNHLNVQEVVEEKFNKIVHSLHKFSQLILDVWGKKNEEMKLRLLQSLLIGDDAGNRWFDKCFQLIV
ncbi:hypothetical protein PENTCL1PPCAC_19017, partial [Pristionchus entomophagus]